MRFVGLLLRSFCLLTCLAGIVIVPLPRIQCRCGAALPHEHSALGFTPHHHHGEMDLFGHGHERLDDGDVELAAHADLRVMTGLPLLGEFPTLLLQLYRHQAVYELPNDQPAGLQEKPDPPPPKSSPRTV